MPANCPLFDVAFSGSVAERPSQAALIMDGRTIDYATLGELSRQIARAIANSGIAPGSRIAVMGRTSLEHCIAQVGIVRAGCAVVPLSTTLPVDVLAALLTDAEPALVLADVDLLPTLEEAGFGGIRRCLADTLGAGEPGLLQWAAEHDDGQAPAPVDGDLLFSIIYSSGTTGVPKGIAHDVRTRSAYFGLSTEAGPGTRTLISTALFTNASFCNLMGVLQNGGTCVLMARFDPAGFVATVQEQRIDRCFLVPAQLKRVLALSGFSADAIASLKTTIMSGSACAPAMKADLAARWPGTLIENYGASEGGVLTMLDVTHDHEHLASVGRPLDQYDVRVLGTDDRILPPGEVGEIIGRSPFVMEGYYHRADLTEEMTWRDSDGALFQRTGDVGFIDAEGFVHLTDRKKDIIISGGLNINATELDHLLESHPAVAEAAVIAAPDERWGETPVAIVVLREGMTEDGEVLRLWANEQVARESRISRLTFAEALPRNAMGKVMKRELRAVLMA